MSCADRRPPRAAAPLALALLLGLSACARGRALSGGLPTAELRPGLGQGAAQAALLEASADTDPGVRGLALAALIRVDPAPGGGAFGPRAAFDPSPWVQRQAIEALAARGAEPASQDLLLGMAGRPALGPYVACAAALRAPGSDALNAVIDANLSKAPTWAKGPCGLAALHHGRPEAAATTAAALEQGELPLELGFLRDLAAEDARVLQPALEAALPLVEPEISAPLAALLLGWGSKPAEAALRAMLDDSDRMVRIGALDELGPCPGPEATALLQRAAAGAPGPERSYAELHLAARGLGHSAALLEAAADPEDRERRARALAALGGALAAPEADRRLQRAAPALLTAGLQDEDDRVQLAALRALRRAAQPALREAVAARMSEEDSAGRVRAEAALTLLHLEAAAR
jgi:hypothetical protein